MTEQPVDPDAAARPGEESFDPDYERRLAADPAQLRAVIAAHHHGRDGRCPACERPWPCPAWESALAAHRLALPYRPAPGVPAAQQARVPPPTKGRVQLRMRTVGGRREWVVIADAREPRR